MMGSAALGMARDFVIPSSDLGMIFSPPRLSLHVLLAHQDPLTQSLISLSPRGGAGNNLHPYAPASNF